MDFVASIIMIMQIINTEIKILDDASCTVELITFTSLKGIG